MPVQNCLKWPKLCQMVQNLHFSDHLRCRRVDRSLAKSLLQTSKLGKCSIQIGPKFSAQGNILHENHFTKVSSSAVVHSQWPSVWLLAVNTRIKVIWSASPLPHPPPLRISIHFIAVAIGCFNFQNQAAYCYKNPKTSVFCSMSK